MIRNQVSPAKLDPELRLRKLVTSHVMVSFFNNVDVADDDPRIAAAQYFATKGFFANYNARLNGPLKEGTRRVGERGLTALRKGTLKPMDLDKPVHAAEAVDAPKLDRTRGVELLSIWESVSVQK